MGAVNTSYTFTATDTINSTKMNNIIDQTTITTDAITGTTLEVASGKLKVRSSGITSNELAASSVSTSKITFANSLLPAGAIMAFAMNSAPSGWLAANGSAVSRTTYATLFAAIGTTYGSGNGSTTFNLPDLRGYFVRGSGTNSDGTASGTFGAKQQDSFEAHTHSLSNQVGAFGEPWNLGQGSDGGMYTNSTTGSTGGTETRPKNIAMLYCIKL